MVSGDDSWSMFYKVLLNVAPKQLHLAASSTSRKTTDADLSGSSVGCWRGTEAYEGEIHIYFDL